MIILVTHVVEANGQEFVRHNEVIYYTDKFGIYEEEKTEPLI